MIQLYIPKMKVIFNNQYSFVDAEGKLLFRHRTNFFRTKRTLVNTNNEVLISSYTRNVFNSYHEIFDRYGSLAFVKNKLKLLPPNEIEIFKEGYRVEYRKDMDLSIFHEQSLVLNITHIQHKQFRYQIDIDEANLEFLLMLMLTIIVMYDITNDSPF